MTALIEAIYTMIERQQEACRVLIFQNVCPNVLRRMISLARGESIAYWKQHLHHITEAELEMLYTHLSNGLMHVVVDGYEKYSREEVDRLRQPHRSVQPVAVSITKGQAVFILDRPPSDGREKEKPC